MRFMFYYLYALANVGFEENYWDQVFMNDLWIKMITTKGDDCLCSRED